MSNKVENVNKEEKEKKILNPREKALKKNLIESLVCFIIGLVLAIVVLFVPLEEDLQIISLIAGIVAFVCFVIAIMFLAIDRPKIKRNYCKNCGEKYDYESDVSWSKISEDNDGKKIVATVEFECECGNCGEEVSFIKKFTTAEVITSQNGNTSVRHYNLKDLVKKYMK